MNIRTGLSTVACQEHGEMGRESIWSKPDRELDDIHPVPGRTAMNGFQVRSPVAFFSILGTGAVTGASAVADVFPRSLVDGHAGKMEEKRPNRSSGNPRPRPRERRGVGLPGARIEAFSGHLAVAAQRPQSHLSERRRREL
jgi:hypothetical protein